MNYRIKDHPILPPLLDEWVEFTWQGKALDARKDEMISSALFAHGIRVFGHHSKDGTPQGIFCANGQCAQCLVLADKKPVKACMTPVKKGMVVEPLDQLPELPKMEKPPLLVGVNTIDIPVLIIGGGPAGMSAAIQLAQHGVKCILIDDKDRLGGKLVLQTHRFFGSINAVYAGTRGIDIATRLENEVRQYPDVDIWINSTALSVFSDQLVGVLREGSTYTLIKPGVLLNTAGAREKSLVFKGNTLPGVYGAGAFQTLVNRDQVKASGRLFIVGGGNVGLIAGYHALQAGIEVVGLVEALPECGGYKVHRDKLSRMGVPIYTSHTILSANGAEQVESVTIAKIDQKFQPIPGTEKSFNCDTILIAVGLDPVNESTSKAKEYGMTVLSAGDAEEIAEASAAMFSGKIRGLECARMLGKASESIPDSWYETAAVLKSHPGQITREWLPDKEEGVFPVLHCSQEIPCNPCTSVCSQGLITIDESDIRKVPRFIGEILGEKCIGCEKCVTICPGLAITLVDFRKDKENPGVLIPYEYSAGSLKEGDSVTVLDSLGKVLGETPVISVKAIKRNDRTVMVRLQAPKSYAKLIAGIRIQDPWVSQPLPEVLERLEEDTIVCRCERVTAGEIRELIRNGYRDMNEIKGVTRAGMGACGGKTCAALILRLFKEEGVVSADVTEGVKRPLFVEVPLGVLAGMAGGEE